MVSVYQTCEREKGKNVRGGERDFHVKRVSQWVKERREKDKKDLLVHHKRDATSLRDNLFREPSAQVCRTSDSISLLPPPFSFLTFTFCMLKDITGSGVLPLGPTDGCDIFHRNCSNFAATTYAKKVILVEMAMHSYALPYANNYFQN